MNEEVIAFARRIMTMIDKQLAINHERMDGAGIDDVFIRRLAGGNAAMKTIKEWMVAEIEKQQENNDGPN
jgi:hypothetical protein